MILTFLFSQFYILVDFLLGFLPSGGLPAAFATALAFFWGTINSFSYIVPVDTMLQALLAVIAFDLAVLGWHILQWVIRKIPGMQ